MLHLWSLGVEEQFYLVWPLIFTAAVFRRRTLLVLAIAAVVVASFAYSVIAAWHQPSAAFYSPLSRLWELGVGGLLACVSIRLPRACSLLGLALITASAILLSPKDAFPGFAALAPALGTALVVASGPIPLLTTKNVVAVGLISYPLYLWHWPLFSFATMTGFGETLVERIALIGLSVVLASGTYALIERPVRFGSLRQWAARGALAAIAATSSIAAGIIVYDGVPARFRPDILAVAAWKAYAYAPDARGPTCWLASVTPFSKFAPECSKGDVVIWGDSHAARLYPGLHRAFGDVAQFTRSSCAPLLRDGSDPCAMSNAAAMQHIRSTKPKAVILFARWAPYELSYADVARTLAQLQLAGAEKVIVLGPAPDWGASLPEIVHTFWRRHGSLPDRLPPAAHVEALETMLSRAANEHGAQFLSISGALCDASGCLTHTPSSRAELVTWDYGHLRRRELFVVQLLNLEAIDAASCRRATRASAVAREVAVPTAVGEDGAAVHHKVALARGRAAVCDGNRVNHAAAASESKEPAKAGVPDRVMVMAGVSRM